MCFLTNYLKVQIPGELVCQGVFLSLAVLSSGIDVGNVASYFKLAASQNAISKYTECLQNSSKLEVIYTL